MKKPLALRVAAVMVLVSVLIGCDTVDNDDRLDNARLSVVLTDAPFPFELVERADVTISRIAVDSESEGEVELVNNERSLNLLALAGGVTAILALNVEIPPGAYNAILLDVTAASVELTDERVMELNVPGERTRIRFGSHQLDAGDFATAVLDFDVTQSFVVHGNPDSALGIEGFTFEPVLRSIGFLKVDDVDTRAELQGVINVIGSNFIELGNNRFFVTDDSEIEGGFSALAVGMTVEVEFFQRSDGILLTTAINIVSDGDEDVHETAGTVDAVDTSGGVVFVTVGALTFRIVPGETKFEGVAGVEGLIVGESKVVVDYYADASTEDLVALRIDARGNE